jgi:hypothetical protein
MQRSTGGSECCRASVVESSSGTLGSHAVEMISLVSLSISLICVVVQAQQ